MPQGSLPSSQFWQGQGEPVPTLVPTWVPPRVMQQQVTAWPSGGPAPGGVMVGQAFPLSESPSPLCNGGRELSGGIECSNWHRAVAQSLLADSESRGDTTGQHLGWRGSLRPIMVFSEFLDNSRHTVRALPHSVLTGDVGYRPGVSGQTALLESATCWLWDLGELLNF